MAIWAYIMLGVNILSIITFLTFWNVEDSDLTGSINRTGEPIQVAVNFYNSSAQVTNAYKEFHGIPKVRTIPLRDGFAVWTEWHDDEGNDIGKPEYERYTCEIHTLKPRRIDDKATLILGHEMLHCIIGSYHR